LPLLKFQPSYKEELLNATVLTELPVRDTLSFHYVRTPLPNSQ